MISPSNAWCRIGAILLFLAPIALAASDGGEKPVVVYYRPAECAVEKTEACRLFEVALAHPAMQRRLAAVVLKTVDAYAGERPSIAIEDPSGREVMRWLHMPSWVTLGEILGLVTHASPHLLEAARAGKANEPFIVEREDALMALAFGDLIRGRRRLDAMRSSSSAENRELAAIWLVRLNAVQPDAVVDDAVLATHAKNGATERVRFEAWMALGDIRGEQRRFEAAVEAFDRAVALAGSGFARQNALTALQNAAEQASPVSGLGLPGSIVAGRKSVWARTAPKNTASVQYRLDGMMVATARRRPFTVAVDFGRIPRRQVLEVTARDREGRVINRGVQVVNERSEAFDVDFVEPRGNYLAGPVDVVLSTRVPRGRAVERVIIEWNGRQIARFTAPPYRTRVEMVGGEQGLLRAVLRLDDGSEVEDVFMANTSMLLEAGAHLVEVPAYFDEPPAQDRVVVRENGIARSVERVIRPEDAPLLIALLIDSSSSMTQHLLDVQEAAVRFVEQNIEPRDRTMVVSFSSNVRVLIRPSGDRKGVESAILGIRPRGGTALHDALVNALLQLHSTGSRKAIVVFSDGLDGGSVFSADDVAEVARRAGVPIYVLTFIPRSGPVPLKTEEIAQAGRHLSELSERTGGKAFAMDTLEGLGSVWNQIGEDLRRQSLVIYRTGVGGEEWRPLVVSVKGRGPVRAPSGVFVTTETQR